MVLCMKTTVEISDGLLREVKHIAAAERTSVRALIETGLRRVVSEHKTSPSQALRDASYGSGGMDPEFEAGGWSTVRDAIYERR